MKNPETNELIANLDSAALAELSLLAKSELAPSKPQGPEVRMWKEGGPFPPKA